MGKIRIESRLLNDLHEEHFWNTYGEYDQDKETLTYAEKNIIVSVSFDKDRVFIKREHPDYDLNLVFEEDKIHQSQYNIKTINKNMDLEIKTTKLMIKKDYIEIEYDLKLNNEDMGHFFYQLRFEEAKMDIKNDIKELLREALLKMDIKNKDIIIEIPKDNSKGDYATNIAMQLTKELKQNPRDIARAIIGNIDKKDIIDSVEVALPGFINFRVNKKTLFSVINEVIECGDNYGRSNVGHNKRVNVEFASINPTGTIHLGHARGSAYGDNLCRILSFAGFEVDREYYINDGGKQIDNLGLSIKERYRGLCGLEEKMPEDGYFGKEIIDIAKQVYEEKQDQLLDEDISYFREKGLKILLERIEEDLKAFRVHFDIWTSERKVREKGRIEETLNRLADLGKTYEQEGAVWLKSSLYGDDKDHVLVKSNGEYAYLTPDIAYHLDKIDRGYDLLIDVFGADHHGYVPRLKASIEALGYDKEKLEVKLIQMVRLLKGGEELKMSKRTGNVVTVNDLIEEVGLDASRYFFAMRNIDTQMDFDIELATKKSNENPVYYVQYAHARICSILKEANFDDKVVTYDTITSEYAYNILAKVQEFKQVVEMSALKWLPHLITNYVYELAGLFHAFYAHEKVLTDDVKASQERIALIKAVKIIIKNALQLIGVEAPEKM